MALVLIGPGSVDQVRITVKFSFSDLDIKVLAGPHFAPIQQVCFMIIFRDKNKLVSIHFVTCLSTLLCSLYLIFPVGTEL